MSVSQSVAVAAPNARHRVGGMLAVAAFLCLTPLVFAPAQIYYGNVTEFANAFPDMLRLLGATALLGTVLLTAVLIALPSGRIRDAGITALVTVAFLFWFQSTVLVWPYGVARRTAHRLGGTLAPRARSMRPSGALFWPQRRSRPDSSAGSP